jgi:hypothetical protein
MGRRASGRSSPAPSRHTPAPAPVAQPPQMMQQAQPRQPGLFGQMAATAGGVAVGSAVGHVIGGALMGGGGRSEQPQQVQPAQAPMQQQPPQQYNQNPCFEQFQQFLQCTQSSSDLSMCQGFNDALKDCKVRYGVN